MRHHINYFWGTWYYSRRYRLFAAIAVVMSVTLGPAAAIYAKAHATKPPVTIKKLFVDRYSAGAPVFAPEANIKPTKRSRS